MVILLIRRRNSCFAVMQVPSSTECHPDLGGLIQILLNVEYCQVCPSLYDNWNHYSSNNTDILWIYCKVFSCGKQLLMQIFILLKKSTRSGIRKQRTWIRHWKMKYLKTSFLSLIFLQNLSSQHNLSCMLNITD